MILQSIFYDSLDSFTHGLAFQQMLTGKKGISDIEKVQLSLDIHRYMIQL